MSFEDEQTLSEVDVDKQAAKFDLQGFLEDARSASVSVTIYSRGDLAGEESRLSGLAAEAMMRGDRVTVRELNARLAEVKSEYLASGLQVTFEERSPDWRRDRISELAEVGVTGQVEVGVALMSGQVIDPPELAGDTEFFDAVRVKLPAQFARLVKAWSQLQPPKDDRGFPVF